jgi:hypothetical protein
MALKSSLIFLAGMKVLLNSNNGIAEALCAAGTLNKTGNVHQVNEHNAVIGLTCFNSEFSS